MKIRENEAGVSEVFGYILILGVVMTALAIFMLMSASYIQGSKDTAQAKQVEQAFTVADSRMSKARFSTSVFQQTAFNLNGGTMVSNDSCDDSYIKVYGANGSLIYNSSMGTIECLTNNGIIGYQDGGVWARYPNNSSVMISPPNFDYNGVTLTLPVTRISGNGAMAYTRSNVQLDVSSTGAPSVIYPGPSGYNPLPQNCYINIYIKSNYAQAWESYINERTKATASLVRPDLVYVNLSTGKGMQSGSPHDGFNTKSMNTENPTPVDVFYYNLTFSNSGADYYANYDSGYVPGKPELKITMNKAPHNLNKNYTQVDFLYTNGSVTEEFQGLIPHNRKSDTQLSVDLLDKNQVPKSEPSDPSNQYGVMFYVSSSPSITWGTNPTVTDSGHVDGYYNSADLHLGEYKSLFDISEHYMRLLANSSAMGPVYTTGNGRQSGTSHDIIPPSYFVLQYDSNQDIKYLYITEGTLNVSFGSTG